MIIGVAASLYFAQRRREFEFASLRAMGAERSQIRRALVLEQGLLLGFAVVAGLGLGYLLLRLVMPYVGTSLGVSFPPPLLVMDWTRLGVALVGDRRRPRPSDWGSPCGGAAVVGDRGAAR